MNISVVNRNIARLKELLALPSTDINWQNTFKSADEVIERLTYLETEIAKNDNKAIKELIFLLAPTGDLQEISISSGWGYEFLGIAEALEKALS